MHARAHPATTATPEPPGTSAPRAFGRYVLHGRIARGGMASVYLAEHRTAEGYRKWLALKTIHPHFADDPDFVAMFHDEARLAARFDHPNICSVFDFGRVGETLYLAMEYLAGEPLGNVVRRAIRTGDLPIALALGVVADAARGLHAAHELRDLDGTPAGVVHRDVSPQNVFVLYSGQTSVVDFGIAKFADKVQRTVAGTVKGKPGYLAPEQLRGEAIDRRADVFALGVVLWECITGTRLFRGESEAATTQQVLTLPVAAPSSVRADCPAALDRVVLRALERDRDARFQTADELALALEGCARAWPEPVGPRATGAWMRAAFADEMAAREAMLRDAAAMDPPVLAPGAVGSVSAASAVSAVGARAPVLDPALRTPAAFPLAETRPAPLPTPRRGPVLALALTAALGVSLGALALALHARRAPAPPLAASLPLPAPTTPAPAPSAASAAPSAPAAGLSADAGASSALVLPTAAPAAAAPLTPAASGTSRVARGAPRRGSGGAPDEDHRPPLRPLRGYPGGS